MSLRELCGAYLGPRLDVWARVAPGRGPHGTSPPNVQLGPGSVVEGFEEGPPEMVRRGLGVGDAETVLITSSPRLSAPHKEQVSPGGRSESVETLGGICSEGTIKEP